MTVQLRIVLDQAGVDADEASAGLALAEGLIRTAPRGCAVSAIAPNGSELDLDGLHEVRRLALARRELAAAWQMGIAAGAGGGLIHAPSLMAPLVRHDRVHDHDQTTVTLWDLTAWESPDLLPKAQVLWQRAMLKRAVKHADAVVVPSHALASRLVEIAPLGDRVRVIAGAAPTGFTQAVDAGRLPAGLRLRRRYVVLTGDAGSLHEGFRAAAAADVDAVVLDVAEGAEAEVTDVARAAGLDEQRVHLAGAMPDATRATVLSRAEVLAATSTAMTWPWRVVEAMELAKPIVAVDSAVHQDVIADGGAVVASTELTDALVDALGGGAQRLHVLASDRARAFSWPSAAERVWALHAEL